MVGAACADIVIIVPPVMQGFEACPGTVAGVAQDREDLVQLICLHYTMERVPRVRRLASLDEGRGHIACSTHIGALKTMFIRLQ